MTLTEHLAELRSRVMRAVLAVAVGVIIVMAAYDPVLRFLLKPYNRLCTERGPSFCVAQLQSLGPLEAFSARLSISMYGGIILALPVVMWEIWRFIVPALHAKEKKYAIPFVLATVGLFALGGFVAYWSLDKALEFLISWGGSEVKANFQVSKYISLVGLMVAAFGVAFEFPVLLVFLQIVGVITPQALLRGWRYAIMIIFVIAAVITPSGDPYSMLAMAIPMSVFYMFSIVIGLMFQKRKRAAEAAAS
jgi:sec-independent protein translocase protein TatC